MVRTLFLLLLLGSAPLLKAELSVLVVGDSLSAGYGFAKHKGWVQLLQNRLDHNGYKYKVINASVSGITTHTAKSNLPSLLKKYAPGIVIIELGGNDGLRGLPLSAAKSNLNQMIRQCRKIAAQVLLIGMRLPPNYGKRYILTFENMYRQLAHKHQIPQVPFLLAGFANNLKWMQADGIHPKATAQPLMLDNVWPHLQPILTK